MSDPIETSASDKDRVRRDYQDILGKPALLKNEDPNEYFKLEATLRHEMDPQSIFQEIELRDLTNKCWEGQRLTRIQVALVESNSMQSLIGLLAPRYGDNHEQATQDAQDYFSGDAKKMRRVEKMLVAMGITAEHIEANAMHLHSSSLHTLDGMIARREVGRNSIIRGRERRQRKAAKKLRNKQAANGQDSGATPSKRSPRAGVPDEQ